MTISFGDIPGVQVGHAQDFEAQTGCSVVLTVEGAVCGVDQRGGAPGTRETDLLRPMHLVEKVHAVLLTGGSAFGLAAAEGVVQWLEENQIGFDVQVARVPGDAHCTRCAGCSSPSGRHSVRVCIGPHIPGSGVVGRDSEIVAARCPHPGQPGIAPDCPGKLAKHGLALVCVCSCESRTHRLGAGEYPAHVLIPANRAEGR